MISPTPQLPREDFDLLYSLLYEELRRLARNLLRREHSAQLSPTTLVHEAWFKLAGNSSAPEWSPEHFRRIAGRAMRQILVDLARQRQARVHGGDLKRVTFDECFEGIAGKGSDPELLALDEALDSLQRINRRQSELVEARFFGGFSCAECTEMFGISEATIMRDWRVARAFLITEVEKILGGHSSA